ncbi:D-glycero-beta-D-manno-heptose-7-phosphate kinase [Leptospira kobayashii]|nr:D-glycero-beta-D-manno-heptose-7-phosphate kinase [Leptospira kobayashii]
MKINSLKLKKAFSQLGEQKIMVVGDLILDEYLFGSVDRISPEAPVPVVWVRKEKQTLGGSGNVVKNLSAFSSPSIVLGRCGADKAGETLKSLLLSEKVSQEDIQLLESKGIPTILKTRIIASQQQVCRVDREEIIPLTQEEEDQVISQVKQKIGESKAIILSDYDKGYLTLRLISEIIKLAVQNHVIVTVDPQVSHFFQYKEIDIMTPNHHEAGKALGRKLSSEKEIEDACLEIAEKTNPKAVMITRGDKGMTVYETKSKQFYHIPTVAKEVFDVTGAGDTVISAYTAFLAAGMSIYESSLIANASAGVVVGKLGAATLDTNEIEESLLQLGLLEKGL